MEWKRREWLKLDALINMKNLKIMDHSITVRHVNDSKEGIKIVKRIKNKIGKLYSDKRNNSRSIYNELEDKAAIHVRKNS